MNIIDRSRSLLASSGIDMAAWNACSTGENEALYAEIGEQVDSSMQLGISLGVNSTPAFFVNGRAYRGAESVEVMREWVDKALAESQED